MAATTMLAGLLSAESLAAIRRDNDERLREIAHWQRAGVWGLDDGEESVGERMLREASADCRDLIALVERLAAGRDSGEKTPPA